MLAIFGICIKIEKLCTGKRSMYIHISWWHTFDFGSVRCLIVTGWNRWCFVFMWRQFWCRLSESLWWRCTRAFASPVCLGILCCAILAKKAAILLMIPKHNQVSFHRSHNISMPRKLNSPQHLFSHFRPRFVDQELRLLYCGLLKPSLGHFGHIQGQAHIRLF